MKKNATRLGAILLAASMISSSFMPIYGSQATTPSSYNRGGQKVEEKVEQKEEKKAPTNLFVIDNFKIIAITLENLGVKPAALEQLIKEGKSLKDVLEVKKIPVKKFKKAVLKEYYKVINEGVENKQISATQGEMLKKAIKEKVMNWLASK